MGDGVATAVVMLQGSEEDLISRVGSRQGRYMKATMVQGQLAIAEAAGVREADMVPFDDGVSKEDLVDEVIEVMADTFTLELFSFRLLVRRSIMSQQEGVRVVPNLHRTSKVVDSTDCTGDYSILVELVPCQCFGFPNRPLGNRSFAQVPT